MSYVFVWFCFCGDFGGRGVCSFSLMHPTVCRTREKWLSQLHKVLLYHDGWDAQILHLRRAVEIQWYKKQENTLEVHTEQLTLMSIHDFRSWSYWICIHSSARSREFWPWPAGVSLDNRAATRLACPATIFEFCYLSHRKTTGILGYIGDSLLYNLPV